MRRSIDRILVSHAGNLPRADDLNRLLAAGESERVALNKRLPSAVAEVVERQVAGGVDVVNDGEYVKAGSYTGYIHQRITGIEVQPVDPNRPPKHVGTGGRDRRDFPGFYASGLWYSGSGGPVRPGFATSGPAPRDTPPQVRVCTGPVQYVGQAHEWRVWEDVQLPEGKILMPGVIGHATDLVEHPELVAQRLVRYARLMGRENVQAGTDCGIGSRVGHEEIVWAKLKALSEGARLASKALWG